MQSATVHSPVASSDREGVPVFSVVIVYEDFKTGQEAKRACDFLVANLSHEWQVNSQMWKFEVLGVPELREIAASDAAGANLIIVSSRGDRELPTEVTAWMENWLGYKGEAVGLVALFDRPFQKAEHARAIQAYLKDVAKRGRMEFFTWPELGPGKESLVLDCRPGKAGTPMLLPAWATTREESYTHWASND